MTAAVSLTSCVTGIASYNFPKKKIAYVQYLMSQSRSIRPKETHIASSLVLKLEQNFQCTNKISKMDWWKNWSQAIMSLKC